MSAQAAIEEPMPTEMRRALSDAVDRLTRSREARIEPKQPAHGCEVRRRVVLSRRTRQKMMSLLRHASNAASGRSTRGDSARAVWGWLRQLQLDQGADSFLSALTAGFFRLPVEQASHAPPGSIIVLAGIAAVKGFGQKYYADGELDGLAGQVLGVYAPK